MAPAAKATIPELMAEARAAQAAGDPDRAGRLYRQVVQQRPDHAGAWLARIELALTQGQARRALRQCAAALELCPGHRIAIETRRARALEARGDRAAALALLQALAAEAPDDLPAVAVLAGVLHRSGDLAGAETAYGEVLRLKPDHPGAWLARSEIALAQGAPDRALERIGAALPLCPDQALPLKIKQVRALDALGRAEEALALARPLLEQAPGNLQLALIEARLRLRSGDPAGAEASYAALLGRWPDHLGAWLARCDLARSAGDPDRALALAAEGLRHLPGDPALTARQAALLLHMEQPEAAAGVLTEALARTPDEPRLQLELARARMQAGQTDAAEALFDACLQRDPDNDAARLGLAEAQAARGAPAAGLATLEARATHSPALGLKCAELMAQAGQGDRAGLLDRLAGEAPGMTEPELLRLFKLGEQSDHSAALVAVVQEIGRRQAISPLIARFLLSRARVVLPPEATARVQAALDTRLPGSGRPEFRAFATALLAGPEAALAGARADLPPRRDTQGAALLGERLLDAGRRQLGFRYLRACVRRWPGAPRLRRQFLRAAIETGRLEAGHAWLDGLEARFPGLDLGLDRMHLTVQESRLEETRDMAEARTAAGLRSLPPRQFLDVTLALGDVGRSAELVREVQSEPGAGRQSAAHFSTTLQGAQFNELRLYRAAEAHALAAGEDPEAVQVRLAQDFFFPAAQIVARHATRLGPRAGAAPGTVPRNIFQYWNTTRVPDEVATLMQSWQAAEGFEHHLYDRARGLAFLREQFGPRHARAFQLANSPAEECDFLRLCLLYKHGGLYADADDLLTGDAAALLAAGPGLIVTRELWGALANNVIVAPAGHPLLLWALRAAGRSLLARENDGTWFKTGPGLMTRAVASWLAQETPEAAEQGLTILTQAQLAAFVQPHVRLSYKTSGTYWNARDRHAPAPLVAALSGLGEGPGEGLGEGPAA